MYHLSIKSISRSEGRTATAAAAYRAGAEITDLRTGELHSYKRKRDVVRELSGIEVPPGAPGWAEDRSALWNAAEAAEKRKNSRVARDYEVTIPKELTLGQGADLVRAFAREISDRYKVAVDFNIHRDDPRTWDGSEKGYQGYHAHILTTTRTLGPDGFGAKSAIEMSDTQRRALGLGDVAAEVALIRERWEILANRHLELAGQEARIDRRSLADQGIDREPTIHLGPAVAGLERRGVTSWMGDFNRQVVAQGQERDGRVQALRDIGDEISVLEKPAEPMPAKPKRVRPSRAQTLPKLDLSGLDGFAKEHEAWDKRQAELKQRQADQEREAAVQNQERQERELQAREERKAAIAWALEEIERQRRERDERVQVALKEAKERRNHREGVLKRLKQSRPEPPRGLLAGFKEKAHRQAVVAWDDAVKVAARLADRGRRLVERVSQLARPEQVRRWAEGVVRKFAPQAVAWYEEDQARQRAQERAQERAREQAARDKAQRQVQEQAVAQAQAAATIRRPDLSRPVPPPALPQKSVRQDKLERDARRTPVLLEKAKSQPLNLADKQQLLAGWTALGQLHDDNLRPLDAEQRRWVETRRRQADLQVAAEMFLNMPRAEALGHYPGLAGHYAMLEAMDRYREGQNLTAFERAQERERSHQRLAAAIEEGQAMSFRYGRLEVIPDPVVRKPEIEQDRGKEPEPKPRER